MTRYTFECIDTHGTILGFRVQADSYAEAIIQGEQDLRYWRGCRFHAVIWRHPDREAERSALRHAWVHAVMREHFAMEEKENA